MVYVWMKLSLNNITEPTRFHAYVVIVVWLLWLPWQCMLFNLRICVWTILYAIVWILLKTCCCINLSLCIVDYSASSLWCHSACVFLSGCILLQAFKGHTSFSLLCVRTPHASHLTRYKVTHLLPTKLSYLPMWAIVVKALLYYPLLGFLLQTVWGLVGTSYWGDPLTGWRVQHRQQAPSAIHISNEIYNQWGSKWPLESKNKAYKLWGHWPTTSLHIWY